MSQPKWEVIRCPTCGAFLFEGRLPPNTRIETYCRRCKKPKDGERPRIVIERKAA